MTGSLAPTPRHDQRPYSRRSRDAFARTASDRSPTPDQLTRTIERDHPPRRSEAGLTRSALKSSDLLRDAQAAPSRRWTNGPIQQRYRPVRPPCADTTWTPLATAGALQHPPSRALLGRVERGGVTSREEGL